MSNIDSVIVIFTSFRHDAEQTIFGFDSENDANAWIRRQQMAAKGLRGTFQIDWVTKPFEPEAMTYRDIPAMTVGSRVLEVTPKVMGNVHRLNEVKRETAIQTMKMEVGMLKTGVFGYTFPNMDRMTRALLCPRKPRKRITFERWEDTPGDSRNVVRSDEL